MWSGTEGFAELNDAIFPGMRSVTGKIKGGIYVEQGDSLAALTTDPGLQCWPGKSRTNNSPTIMPRRALVALCHR